MMRRDKAISIILVIALSLSMVGCNGTKTEEFSKNSFDEQTDATVQDINEDNQGVEIVQNNEFIDEKPKETIREYSIVSSEGIDVIGFDSASGCVEYKGICANCGKTGGDCFSSYIKEGTFRGSYRCAWCGESTNISIKTEMKVTYE